MPSLNQKLTIPIGLCAESRFGPLNNGIEFVALWFYQLVAAVPALMPGLGL